MDTRCLGGDALLAAPELSGGGRGANGAGRHGGAGRRVEELSQNCGRRQVDRAARRLRQAAAAAGRQAEPGAGDRRHRRARGREGA